MVFDSSISLNPAQQFIADAKMLETGFSCILQLPTGTGKTWLAKKSIWGTLHNDRRAIYLTPLRALANELHPLWQTEFSPHKVGIFTGDYGQAGQKVPVPFADAKVLIMTPERLDACTRAWRAHWHWIPEVDTIVIDEVHILGDRHRGARLEGAVSRFRRLNPFSRYLCLSATLGNREQLADWFQGIEFESKWRPVPLSWRIVRYRKADQKPFMLVKEVIQTRKAGGRSLVFVQSRRRCEILSNFLKDQGICTDYHHAGLTHKKRRSIEKTFRSSKIDTLIATGTLEMGLNMPVRQVILYDTQTYDGAQFTPLTVNTVWQRAGRAGRPGLDTSGEAVLFTAAWDRATEHYPRGKFEKIESALRYPEALAEQIVAEVGSGLCRSERQLERAMNNSLAALQKKALPINKMVKRMISADMMRLTERDKGSSRLTTTPLGRITTRHLLQPLTVMMFRDLLINLPDFTQFDALFTLALTPDCEPVIPVDFEELPILAQHLDGSPSFTFDRLNEARKWFTNPSGKRILSALKTAAMLLAWCKEDDQDVIADEYSIYAFELTRLQESFNRLLMAAAAISKHVLEDPNNACSDETPEKPEATKRLELLCQMIISTLPSKSATLTFVKGIGAKWARKLRDYGYIDIHTLGSASLETLRTIPGLSSVRAKKWIVEAKTIAEKPIPSTENIAPLIECDLPFAKKEKYDPYRLRRAMELTVSPQSNGRYIVSGGLEPHRVSVIGNEERCDCADFAKGNICKHIIAVKHQLIQSDIRSAKNELPLSQHFNAIDLFDLWFES